MPTWKPLCGHQSFRENYVRIFKATRGISRSSSLFYLLFMQQTQRLLPLRKTNHWITMTTAEDLWSALPYVIQGFYEIMCSRWLLSLKSTLICFTQHIFKCEEEHFTLRRPVIEKSPSCVVNSRGHISEPAFVNKPNWVLLVNKDPPDSSLQLLIFCRFCIWQRKFGS